MAEPQIQDQPNAPVTVRPGGAETAPVSKVPEQKEPQIEVAPDLRPPEVSEDLSQAGVRYNTINPQVSQEAVEAGVSQSIPTSTKFAVPNYSSVAEANKVAETGPVEKAKTWSAREWVMEQLKALKKAA